jgi:hypothetical protein
MAGGYKDLATSLSTPADHVLAKGRRIHAAIARSKFCMDLDESYSGTFALSSPV